MCRLIKIGTHKFRYYIQILDGQNILHETTAGNLKKIQLCVYPIETSYAYSASKGTNRVKYGE